jgi:hypothetical protein
MLNIVDENDQIIGVDTRYIYIEKGYCTESLMSVSYFKW